MGTTAHAGRAGRRLITEITLAGDKSIDAADPFGEGVIRPFATRLVHDDRVVGAVLVARAAPDTETVYYFHNIAYVCAADRARWTPYEAHGIFTVITRPSYEETSILVPFTDKTGAPSVRVGTPTYTVVAPSAHIEINDQDAVALDETLGESEVHEVGRARMFARVP